MKIISEEVEAYDCPEITELIAFVFEKQQSTWVGEHIKQCELCKELTEGIATFKKKYATAGELYRRLEDNDKAFLKTLKFPEHRDDFISEIAWKLGLPDALEKKIREELDAPEDEPSDPGGEER